jgi:hypothetical protein
MKREGLCDLSVGRKLRGLKQIIWFVDSLKVETLKQLKPESGEYYFDYDIKVSLNDKSNSLIVSFYDSIDESYSEPIILKLEVPIVIFNKYGSISLNAK